MKKDRRGISFRECLLGPGSVFLIAWIIISLLKIGDPNAWGEICYNFLALFFIWAVWCLYLNFARKYSWDLYFRQKRHKRRMAKLSKFNKKKEIGNYGIITIATSILLGVFTIINVADGIKTAIRSNMSYSFADFWDIEICILLGCLLFWIILAFINVITERSGPDVDLPL